MLMVLEISRTQMLALIAINDTYFLWSPYLRLLFRPFWVNQSFICLFSYLARETVLQILKHCLSQCSWNLSKAKREWVREKLTFNCFFFLPFRYVKAQSIIWLRLSHHLLLMNHKSEKDGFLPGWNYLQKYSISHDLD